jgi:hypothetical protein
MKRIPELRDLSEDHHHSLALARKARRAALGEAGLLAGDVWSEVEVHVHDELVPHFLVEETLIAPGLDAAGETALTKRLFEDHRALRECVRPGNAKSLAALGRFGELLENHIRFEERVLFETAQCVLTPESLRAVAEACRARRS